MSLAATKATGLSALNVIVSTGAPARVTWHSDVVPGSARQAVVTQVAREEVGQFVAHAVDAVGTNQAQVVHLDRNRAEALGRFAAAPSGAGLVSARETWLAAREWYGLTEAFRFYGGPIDGDDGPEGRINAWPLDENSVSVDRKRIANIRRRKKLESWTPPFPW